MTDQPPQTPRGPSANDQPRAQPHRPANESSTSGGRYSRELPRPRRAWSLTPFVVLTLVIVLFIAFVLFIGL